MTDIKHDFGSDVLVIRACYHEDAWDLLAVAGDGTVQVIQCADGHDTVRPLACFIVGLRVISVAWSPRSVSPCKAAQWYVELAVSTQDFGLYLLSKSFDSSETIRRFGGGLTGHHARVNDITFLGGEEDNAGLVATVSGWYNEIIAVCLFPEATNKDDRNLLVWDLRSKATNKNDSETDFLSDLAEAEPTALAIPFVYPLCSVSSHPSTSKQLLVSDARGSVFLIDWRKDPNDNDEDKFTHENTLELVQPKSLANATANMARYLSGCASWCQNERRLVGAVFGPEFALWDISKLKGGKPYTTGQAFPEGGHRFRWCPSHPDYFAISTSATTKMGAVVRVHNVKYLKAQSNPIHLASVPHRVTDVDWIGSRHIPRLAAAVGREVYIFPISLD